jgi:hypothetical protein
LNARAAIFILACCIAGVQAQISVEEVSTDTVDLFNQPRLAAPKHTPISLISTLIIPGSAHQFIGRPKSALGYISLDAIALFSAVFFDRFAMRTTNDARAFAAMYAHAPAGTGEDYYWQMVGAFDNFSDYLEALYLNRSTEMRFNEVAYVWQWDDKIYREEFIEMQKNAKRYVTISSFCIGAMVLNRVIAFIDMRSSLKNKRYNGNASLSVTPYISEGLAASGLAVRSDF